MVAPAENTPPESNIILESLTRLGLVEAGETPLITPLTGGVSAEICRVDLKAGPVCVKRALGKLLVEQDWFVPVERNAFEVAWIRTVGEIVPGAVPTVLADDPGASLFVMDYLHPRDYPVWKNQLRDGDIDEGVAAGLGALIATIHGATANNAALAQEFRDAAPLFHALRLDPYFLATASRHEDCAKRIGALVAATEQVSLTLIHGDFSPKNILIGPNGPVILDSETGCYGDPAFDLAFCLNHLLLKCVWRPHWAARYLRCFDALSGAYLAGVSWEPAEATEERAAKLLSALLLARIDGKSPVEYITDEADKDRVREVAKPLILDAASSLTDVKAAWAVEFGS